MSTTFTIGVVDQTTHILYGSATLKFNTLDLTLVDPATVPAMGDAVAVTNPTWSGTVSAIRRTDPVDRATGHQYVEITATNTATASASAAPFNLSDAPNGSTTYGYRGLSTETQTNQDGTTSVHGSCTVQQTGLWPAMTFTLTSTNQGYSATSFSITQVTVTWDGVASASPTYEVEFGDPIVTMSVWANSTSAGILPITTTKITDGAVTTPKLDAGAVIANVANIGGTVTIDPSGITITDGVLDLEDAFGSTVVSGAGFGGSWTEFIGTGTAPRAVRGGQLMPGDAGISYLHTLRTRVQRRR